VPVLVFFVFLFFLFSLLLLDYARNCFIVACYCSIVEVACLLFLMFVGLFMLLQKHQKACSVILDCMHFFCSLFPFSCYLIPRLLSLIAFPNLPSNSENSVYTQGVEAYKSLQKDLKRSETSELRHDPTSAASIGNTPFATYFF
jgi:hypothetical protein